jgi:ribosome maturation factor RimP
MLTTPLEQLVEDCVSRHGAHLIEIIVRGHQHRPVLEVFVDAEDGVTTDLCSAISKAIQDSLLVRPLLDTKAQLTVSSPGIDRPLRFPWQYRKHVGRDLALRFSAMGSEEECSGRLVGVDGDGLLLETGRPAEQRRISFDTVVRAVVKTPW